MDPAALVRREKEGGREERESRRRRRCLENPGLEWKIEF